MDDSNLIDQLIAILGDALEKIPDPEVLDSVQNPLHLIFETLNETNVDLDAEQASQLINKIAEVLNVAPETISDNLETISKMDLTTFGHNIPEQVTDASQQNIFEEFGFTDPQKGIIKRSVEPANDIPDETLNHDESNGHGHHIPFLGYAECTLCSCGHYTGGDSMTSICTCGHQKQQHRFRHGS